MTKGQQIWSLPDKIKIVIHEIPNKNFAVKFWEIARNVLKVE